MASKRQAAAGQTVDDFLAALDHPYQAEIATLRQIILAADARIREAIKWNAPSFYTTEHFATFHLRTQEGVQLILHRGAKVRAASATTSDLADPAGLLKWLAPDRAAVRFREQAEINAKQMAFVTLIQSWINYL